MEKINLFLETRLSPASIFKSDYCRLKEQESYLFHVHLRAGKNRLCSIDFELIK